MKTRSQCGFQLKSALAHFASFYEMNALELAAWCYLLRLHVSCSDSLDGLIEILQMTGYHTKSLLGHKMDCYLCKLVGQEATFPEKYARWCRDSMACTSLSLGQVNSIYKEMNRGILALRKPKLLNQVVDDVIEAEISEIQPGKVRKTTIFKCELAGPPFQPLTPYFEPFEAPLLDEITGGLFDVNNYLS
jgi:hypothetical protein